MSVSFVFSAGRTTHQTGGELILTDPTPNAFTGHVKEEK
jgi:hypothetical protein